MASCRPWLGHFMRKNEEVFVASAEQQSDQTVSELTCNFLPIIQDTNLLLDAEL